MAISVHELTEYISWASDDYLHLALSDGTDGKISKANIVSGLTGAGALDVYYVKRSNNLSDIANPALARANLNLGSVALLNQITKANIVDFSEADYATAAQGSLADSALQAGDNISELVNDAGYIPSSQKGVANGVASLNSNGKIPETQIPAIAITDTFVVDSEAEMLALDAQVGDVAIRNDESRSYILQGTDPSDLSDWQELKTPTGGVASVNGQTGTVVLNADDIDDTSTINKFVTGAQLTKIDSVETGAQVNQNAFSTIAVAGQSDVIADSKTDTITFVGGTGVNISTDPVTDTITFEATGVGTGSIEEVIAGTGLTGGGTTSTVTLNVSYGTTVGTAAQGNDPRLSDAREWDADTVPQPEAEGGTATTRRAWTSLRVRQAIVAWWNTVGTTVGKAILNLANPSAIRFLRINADNTVTARTAAEMQTDLGLGTAATATLTTSNSDTTIGRVLKVGDYSIGTAITLETGVDLNTYTTYGRYWVSQSGLSNGPEGSTMGGVVNVSSISSAGIERVMQDFIAYGSTVHGRRFYRIRTDATTWTSWYEFYNTNNLTDATTSTHGLMSSTDKTKLDGVDTGAEVNQNAFTTISVAGQGDVVADTKTDTLTLVGGTGVNISTDPVTDTITFEATGTGTGTIEEVIAGDGLIGGGTSSTVALNVGAGTGITVGADTVGLDTANTRNVDHSAVSITAGTGLTGGGDLTATRTLNVSYGTTAGTAAQGNDSRLSDSREWTATTIGQSEAEAGTATTRRAWTAQRVRQAVLAVTGAVGTTVGRALFALTNPNAVRFLRINADNTISARTDSEMRTDLGLGTAATATLTTSASDTTIGRVLKVGDFNIGTPMTMEADVDLDTKDSYGDFVVSGTGLTNGPIGSVGGYLSVRLRDAGGTNRIFQSFLAYGTGNYGRSFTRIRTDDASDWTPWVEQYNTSNVTGAVTSVMESNLTASRALVSDASGKIEASSVTSTEIGYLSGVTSGIQTQLNEKASTTVATTSVNGLMSSSDKTKLNGIASGATANQTDAYLLNRTNHTGTQAHTTITGLGTAATRDVGVSDSSVMRVLQRNNAAPDILDLNAENNSPSAWNRAGNYIAALAADNNVMAFNVSGTQNARTASIQVGHGQTDLAAFLGTLHLNPLGGDVRINGSMALHSGNITTTTGQSTAYPMTQKAVTDALNEKVNTIDLGTAATETVVTGTGDTTASRIPTVEWVLANAGTGSGTITEVVAGNGLTGGGTSSTVTLNVGAGDGISVAANTVAVDSTVVRTTGTQSIGGAKTFTSEVTAPSFNTTSSLKYKKDVMPFENALEKLMAIDVITYKRKIPEGEPQDDKTYLGVSAESLAKVVPELVNFKDGEADSVNYAQGFALCVQAIQELVKNRGD